MALVSQKQLKSLIKSTEDGESTVEKGRALEELICFIFERIPGIIVTKRNRLNAFQSEEVDLAFWNDKDPRGFPFLPPVILVECKNWSKPIGSEEVSWFDSKLRNRGLSFGILVAANGITGKAIDRSAAHQTVTMALGEGRNLVVLTLEEIKAVSDTKKLVTLFKEKLCELVVTGTIFP